MVYTPHEFIILNSVSRSTFQSPLRRNGKSIGPNYHVPFAELLQGFIFIRGDAIMSLNSSVAIAVIFILNSRNVDLG